MSNIIQCDHPLVQHKISLLRTRTQVPRNSASWFRRSRCSCAMRLPGDLPLKEVQIETPLGLANSNIISGRKVAFVPIMRAGLGMMDGALALVPAAKVGHIGLYRDEANGNAPQEYYCKLPFDIANREVIILDPMLATGGSAVKAVDIVKKAGAKQIKFMCIITCPEGLKAFQTAHPDVDIICGAVDKGLNENSYIVPGIGDCGDRLFGTK